MKIKICGIKTPDMAEYAVEAGADFIGLVSCKKSPRFVDTETASNITQLVQSKGKIPVAVFSDAQASTMKAICEQTGIDHVQFHGDQRILYGLPQYLHKMYTQTSSHHFIRPSQDYLLLDGPVPGSGRRIDYSKIKLPDGVRCFIAGGLAAHHMPALLKIIKPYGVDVSSGVESSRGVKSADLIKRFIDTVRGCHG